MFCAWTNRFRYNMQYNYNSYDILRYLVEIGSEHVIQQTSDKIWAAGCCLSCLKLPTPGANAKLLQRAESFLTIPWIKMQHLN